jgi:hypothetical protein
MSMPEERRGRLDHAIDRAVREMVQVDPRPGLRHRVANRLAKAEAPGAASLVTLTFAFPRPYAVIAAAAAVLVMVAAFGLLRGPELAPEVDVVESTPAVSPVAAAPSLPPVTASEPVAAPVGTARAERVPPPGPASIPPARDGIFGERNARIRAANVPAERADVAADADLLVEPALPLVEGGIPPIEAITIEPIRLAPLTIRPVTLSAPSGGK